MSVGCLTDGCYTLFIEYMLSFAVSCFSFVVCALLCGVCCSLLLLRCVLFVVCCVLSGVRCWLPFVV